MIKTHKSTEKWRIICFRICQKILILRRSEEVIRYLKVTAEPHVHPFHEIFYLSSGECTSFIDHNIYKFGKGDLVIVPGGCLHKTVYTGKGIHERIVISFRQEITDWIKEQIGAEYLKNCMVPGVINIPEKRRNYVDSLLDKLMFENDTPDILSTAFIKAGLVELLLFIIRCKEYEDNVIKEIDVDNRKIQEVATYIFEHYTENILLEDVADKFDMSKSFLSKRFKTATGFGFKEYIINLRIQNACRLLLETDKSITDIAFECGFNDSNYFGDSFRKIKGISPRKYRKNETF